MIEFQLPADFFPEFSKAYNMADNEFEIGVQYMGIRDRLDGFQIAVPSWAPKKPMHVWLYAICVNGHVIEAGPKYWDPSDRQLTLENVCNHLASFWGHSEKIREAQDLEDVRQTPIDRLVLRCYEFLKGYFLLRGLEFDYDILTKHIDEDGWTVTLCPNNPRIPECVVVFNGHTHATGENWDEGVDFSHYLRERAIKIALP